MKKHTWRFLGVLIGFSIVLLGCLLVLYLGLGRMKEEAAVPEKYAENQGEPHTDPREEVYVTPDLPEVEEEFQEIEEESAGQVMSLVLGGDVNIHRFQDGYKRKGIGHMLAEDCLKIMTDADFTMVNQEFPFSDRGEPMEDKTYTFREDPSLVTVLSDMGVDMVSLANNHILDYGREALEDTLNTLHQAGIPYGGAGMNYEEAKSLRIFEIKGKKLGVLCASRVIPVSDWNATAGKPGVFTTYDPTNLIKEIKAAKKQCDLVLVYVHWGVERQELPESYQQTMARQYIDSGADMVIGAHPHIWQGIEFYKGKPIAYSLGNLIFSNTTETALLKIEISEENQMGLTVLPLERSGYQLISHRNKQEFLQKLQNISFGVKIEENGKVVEVAGDVQE